jgi:PAS domain S-box-containing protein
MDGRFRRINPAWEDTLGFSREELMSRLVVELIHPEDRAASRSLGARLRDGLDVVRFENRYMTKAGGHRWISWTCRATNEDGEVVVYGAGRDVTEQREAEEKLARKTAELEAVFKALPDLLFRTDEAGRIIDYTAGKAADLYAPPETFIGKTFLDVLPPDVGSAIWETMARAHETGRIETLEYDLDVPSGKQRFEARVIAFSGGHTITVVRNVTDRWMAQRALAASEERLRESERLEAVGRLAGGIAHDFNNLMMIVLMHSDGMLRVLRPGERYRRELLEIRAAGERATGLTRQLLAFARKQVLSPTVLDLCDVVRVMDGMLRGLIGENVELRFRCETEPLWVRADRSQLEQVLLNLVLNARDAMPRGGVVNIELCDVEIDEAQAARLDLARAGGYVRLVVTDNGSGIDPEDRPHIFEPFFTTKGFGSGTGLGLATVYGIVRQSGGSVTVESKPGEGSSFIVVLPVAEGRAPRLEARTSDIDELPSGTETILVVEDDLGVRRAVIKTLAQLGYTILEAGDADGAMAVSAAHKGTIDLLLTDVVMPGKSGPELAARFFADRPDAKVVYMSGYSAEADTTKWPHGPLLQKPFSPQELASRVRSVLDGVARELL